MSKQKFKGKTLYTKTCVRNITRVFDDAPEHIKNDDWYADARQWAHTFGKVYSVDWIKVAGIIAALSPQKSWDENVKLAQDYLATGKAGHTHTMVSKCHAIMELDDSNLFEDIAILLNGNKIVSFFLNIADPHNTAVTIDRHAQDVALGKVHDGDRQMTSAQYEFFSNCYRIAAKKLGVKPYHLQAVTWVHWRVLKQNGQEESLSDFAEAATAQDSSTTPQLS